MISLFKDPSFLRKKYEEERLSCDEIAAIVFSPRAPLAALARVQNTHSPIQYQERKPVGIRAGEVREEAI